MEIQVKREVEWPRVAIIVLNWNGWQDTIECLESLLQITYPNYQIIVVDNGSTDDSVEKIKAWARGEIIVKSPFFETSFAKKPIRWLECNRTTVATGGFPEEEEAFSNSNNHHVFIKANENLGFSGGNNVGIRFVLRNLSVRYIWLLNSDTIVHPTTLELLVSHFMKNSKLGIISPKICYYSYPDRIWFAGGRLGLLRAAGYNLGINKLNDDRYSGLLLCTFISGCAMLIKREVIENIGLLDPAYFLYVEDVDFSCRAIRAGWNLAANLDSVIYHKVSSSLDEDPLPLQTYYLSRNRLYFSKKFHSSVHRMAFRLFWFLSRALKFVFWVVKGRSDLIGATIRGYIDYENGHMGILCDQSKSI